MAKRSRGGGSKGLTQSQRTFTEHAYQAASEAGLSGVQADLAVSQAIHESAWGTKPSGTNNYHGIKGKGSKVKTHEIEGGKRKNITASFRDFGSMTDSFRAWSSLMSRKFSAAMNAKTLPEALKALRAGKPGGYATDPQYNQKITNTANKLADVGVGPWGAGPAQAYQRAQYQRAMPPSLPATAPTPTVRPGGSGALRQAATGLTTASPVSTPPDDSQAIAQQAMQRAYAGQTLADMRTGQNIPVTPAALRQAATGLTVSPALRQAATGLTTASPLRQAATGVTAPSPLQAQPSSYPGRPPGPVGGFPARSVPTPTPRPTEATVAQQRAGYHDYGASLSRAPVTPVGRVAAAAPAAVPSSFPARPATVAQTPARAPAPALQQAATGLTVATPGTTPTQGRLPASVAVPATAPVPTARPATSVALNPDRVKDDVIARTPAAAAQTLATVAEKARPAAQPATVAKPATVATTAARTLDRWAGVRTPTQPAVDPATTQAVTAPTTFGQKIGNFAQRNIPAIAGSLIAGPVGGLIGSVLGRAFDNAQPGQVLGNPFQGLGGSLKAMGMFQSRTPYAGPVSTYGYGTRAIGDVLGGNAPVGARAYSRSTPGYSVTSLPNGMVEKTNQYGFTSFEKAPGFSGPGVFGGGGFSWGGRTEKASSGKSSSGKSTGGRKSDRAEAAGYR